MNKNNTIWISWESHRRSKELADALEIGIFELVINNKYLSKRPFKYFLLIIKTLYIIILNKPKFLFIQNPSIILALFLSLLRNLFKYKLIVDRHSNFKLSKLNEKRLKWKVFHKISKYTIKMADLTIVTNKFLMDLVNDWGGRAFVLEDKLPSLELGKKKELKGKINIVFISTFSQDEPITEFLEAIKKINDDCFFYITGDYKSYITKEEIKNQNNVVFTGYINELEYQSLLLSSDIVMVLTKEDNLLNCGAYEGLSLKKPLILSNTEAIKSYFKKGATYTDVHTESITSAIRNAIENLDSNKVEIDKFRVEVIKKWNIKFSNLIKVIESF